MPQYQIVTESTADLTAALAQEFDLTVIPMRFALAGSEYRHYPDFRALSPQDFYRLLKQGARATTSAVNLAEFAEWFSPILQRGEDVLYLGFSSALSGTVATARIAAQELQQQYPGRRIVVINTLCACMGEGLLACLAAQQRQAGLSLDALAAWVQNMIPQICHWFTVDDLMHLHRGGRIGAVSAHLGAALGIKPLMHLDDGGRLAVVSKVRGTKQAQQALCDAVAQRTLPDGHSLIFIAHADAPAQAEQLAALLQARCAPKRIEIAPLGPIIGAHTGPGALTVYFVGKAR